MRQLAGHSRRLRESRIEDSDLRREMLIEVQQFRARQFAAGCQCSPGIPCIAGRDRGQKRRVVAAPFGEFGRFVSGGESGFVRDAAVEGRRPVRFCRSPAQAPAPSRKAGRTKCTPGEIWNV